MFEALMQPAPVGLVLLVFVLFLIMLAIQVFRDGDARSGVRYVEALYRSSNEEVSALNAYTERNIKRIDGELEILNSDVDDLSDTTWEQHVEIERLKLSPLQRWARGVVRGWVE